MDHMGSIDFTGFLIIFMVKFHLSMKPDKDKFQNMFFRKVKTINRKYQLHEENISWQ